MKEFDRENAVLCKKMALPTARALLSEKGNRVTLILSILICAMASFAPTLVISWPLAYFLDWESLYYNSYLLYAFLYYTETAVRLVFFFLTALPLYLGLYRMAVRMSREESVHLLDTFYYFSSAPLYGRALAMLLRALLLAAPVLAASLLFSLALESEDGVAMAVLSTPVIVGAFVLSLLLFSLAGGYFTLAMIREDLPLSECRGVAKEISRGKVWVNVTFLLSLSVRLLLSLLPAGVLFLLHTMPACLLANANYVGRLSEGVIDLNS